MASTTHPAPEPALSLFACRFRFRALDRIYFPPGKAANTLRGALGMALPQFSVTVAASDRAATVRERPVDLHPRSRPDGCGSEELRAVRSGADFFKASDGRSSVAAHAPSGFADPPRPFILRTQALEAGAPSHDAGSIFSFDIHLFLPDPSEIHTIAAAFERYSSQGIGPAQGRMDLVSISTLSANRTETEFLSTGSAAHPIHLSLTPGSAPVSRLVIAFTTPTELKHESSLAAVPEFQILFARLRDRISALHTFYGPGPLEVDFKALAERARNVRLVDSGLEHQAVTRHSSRTGQRHPIGGFTGTAVYEGPLTDFVPWLRAGYWTGVGRQTVWGKGVVQILEGA